MITKFILKILFFSTLIINNHNCYAKEYLEDNHLLLGLDYKVSYNQGRDYWNKLLPTQKVYQYVALFTGKQFSRYLSGEIGYASSFNITKNSDISGVSMWGNIAPSSSKQAIKLAYKSWHVDLNLVFPNDQGAALLAIIGTGVTKPKIAAVNLGDLSNNDRIANFSAKRKLLARLGVGIRFTKGAMGIRSKLMWENLSKVKLYNQELSKVYPQMNNFPFKNNYIWTIGIFYRF